MDQSIPPSEETSELRVDIVSDVVCPWCIIGFKQLERALLNTDQTAQIFWHPFELNPQMGPEGQDLSEHVAEKYGSTAEQSATARKRISELGSSLGFHFNYDNATRMVNTFRAHQLIQWAGEQGYGHQAKMALFHTFFTLGENVDDLDVLTTVADRIGLNPEEARHTLEQGIWASAIREEEKFWTSNGIQGVPAMVFNRQHLVTGAQGVKGYESILNQLAEQSAH